MAQVNNSAVLDRLKKDCFLQTAVGGIPNQLSGTISPVIVANPKEIVEDCHDGVCINATSSTLYTTPSKGGHFYITSAYLHVVKDATSTSTRTDIRAYINGTERLIQSITGFTLTAQDKGVSLNFDRPIKVDRGTAITLRNSTAVANISTVGAVFGYFEREE